MAGLTIQSIADTLDSVQSWNTRVSRTRVSTVDGFACTEASDSAVQSLEGVLRMVKRLKLKQCQYSEIEEIELRVGEGETFVVDKCQLAGKVIAVKHIKLGDYNVDQRAFHRRLQSVVREISIMYHQPLAQHPHVLKLLGYGWKLEGSSPLPYIVVEYGVGGDLRSYLLDRKQSTLKAKIIHCGDVACGLMALHQCGIVHGDLKLNNVIIFESWDRPSGTIAKLCDFGHSLLLAVENPETLRYVGTTLYNAPEVATQRNTPIEWENLHKCDIWAYGLLVWEVLANGEIYFKKKWRHDPNYARSTREVTNSVTSGDTTTGDATQEESIQPEEEGVMGKFDSKHLRNLAIAFANTLKFPIFEKGYFPALFRLTLQEDPSQRLSDLNRLPIVSVWNSSGASSLQHKLAMHVGTSEFTFDLFQGRDIPWEHQVSMLSDFERVAKLRQGGEQATAAAFHVALCFILGFGTKVDYAQATQYLRNAQEQAHPMAQLFGPRLLSRISNLPASDLTNYTDAINQGLKLKRFFSKSTKIVITTNTPKSTDNDLKGLELDTDATQPQNFANFAEFRDWVLVMAQYHGELIKWHAAVGTGPKMNFLECAIAFEDSDLVGQLLNLKKVDENDALEWDVVGAWGETPLVQAIRRGHAKIVSLLLNAGHKPWKPEHSGASAYHWLFCLTSGNDEAVVQSLFASLLLHPQAPEAIEEYTDTTYTMHPQWPLVFSGTPLAFAVISGSLTTVEALLQYGANPRDPAYAPGENGKPSNWTALHLAVRYQFSNILTALVQKAGEDIRNSSNPLQELGIPLDRSKSRNPFYRASLLKAGDIPEALLAEALLEYPNLQLPCVLPYMTIVERYGIHGANYRQAIRDILDILPTKSLEWRSANGQTALMQAIDFIDYDLASVLLDRSPGLASKAFRDPEEPTEHTWPFHFACQIASRRDSEETTDIANRILQLHPRAILDKDSKFRTALHMSVGNTSSRVTEYLLFHGAPIDAEDAVGSSALHYVRSLANLTALLDKGANIDYTNELGLAPIHVQASIGAEDTVAELVKRGAKLDLHNNEVGTPLHCAVARKSKGSVIALVQGGAPLNARDNQENTPITLAARSGRGDILQYLMDAGANISLCNRAQLTALRVAIMGKHSGMVEKILKHDVNHIAKERNAFSVFHLAAELGDASTMKALVDLIPKSILSVNALNGTKQTPLHSAALRARYDIAEVLLEQRPNLEVADSEGSTALLTACSAGKKGLSEVGGSRTEFVDLIVTQRPGLLLTRDRHGHNPWTWARRYDDFSLMAYILEHLHILDRLPQLLYRDPPDQELMELAMVGEEWDFVTTCLRTGALPSALLPSAFSGESRTDIDKLYVYANKRDKAMVQWIFEQTLKGSIRDNRLHTGSRFTGMRNMYLEFNESRPPLADPAAPPMPAVIPPSPAKNGPSSISTFLSSLREKSRSSKSPLSPMSPIVPTSPLSPQPGSPPEHTADLYLSPTTTNHTTDSSAQSPSHARSSSFGSSEGVLNRTLSLNRKLSRGSGSK